MNYLKTAHEKDLNQHPFVSRPVQHQCPTRRGIEPFSRLPPKPEQSCGTKLFKTFR